MFEGEEKKDEKDVFSCKIFSSLCQPANLMKKEKNDSKKDVEGRRNWTMTPTENGRKRMKRGGWGKRERVWGEGFERSILKIKTM